MAKRKKGRKKTQRKRLGRNELKVTRKLLEVIRGFEVRPTDSNKRETDLNYRLIKQLRAVNDGVVNKGIASVLFVNETYRPECTLTLAKRPYALFAVECKKLHDHSAKRLFKEGLSQAMLYLTKAKVVVLVLYDFTSNGDYLKAFGPGNTLSSRMAARMRRCEGLHIIVRRRQ